MAPLTLSNVQYNGNGKSLIGSATRIEAEAEIGRTFNQGGEVELCYRALTDSGTNQTLDMMKGDTIKNESRTTALEFEKTAHQKITYSNCTFEPMSAIVTTAKDRDINDSRQVGCQALLFGRTNERGAEDCSVHLIPDASIRYQECPKNDEWNKVMLYVKDNNAEPSLGKIQAITASARTNSSRFFIGEEAMDTVELCEIAEEDYEHWMASHEFTGKWGSLHGQVTVFKVKVDCETSDTSSSLLRMKPDYLGDVNQ